jgi:hypothetical protein
MHDIDFWPNGLSKAEYDFFGNPIQVIIKSSKLEPQYAFKEFWLAIEQRICNPSKSITDDGRDYKNYYNLKESLRKSITGENGSANYFTSKLGGYFKNLHQNDPSILYLRTNNYLKDYIYLLDNWIEQYGINRHDVVYIDLNNIKIINETKLEIKEDISINQIDDNLQSSVKKGRPLGSKNKKETKELFFPEHALSINDQGHIIIESLILAIADLVWRQNNQKDLFYINKLKLTTKQLAYVNHLFINKSNKLINKYWKINVIDGQIKLIALRKRAGYYYLNSNREHKFITLTELSKYFNLQKTTLEYKLKFKSIKDIKIELSSKFS